MAKRSEYGSYRNPMSNGYIRVYCPGHPTAAKDGYALEHRYVAWEAGLFDDLDLHVHHINEVKDDNRVENLEVLTESEHHRRHAREAGVITNQFGTFPIAATEEERLERRRQVWRDYYHRKQKALAAS